MATDEAYEAHDPAGHAEHFLQRLDRLDRERMELALVMYRDHEAVAAVLERLPASRGTQRVAFALTHDPEPPYVLVTHEGRFVTCLAAGMQPGGCYAVTFAQFNEALRKVRVDDARLRAWKERSARGPQSLLLRLVNSDGWIAREDISALLAVRAAMERELVLSWIDMTLAATQHAASLAKIDKPVLRARVSDGQLRRVWRSFASIGHLGIMAAAGHSKPLEVLWQRAASERLFPSWDAVLKAGDPYVCVQTLNVVARGGRHLLPMFKRELAEARSTSTVVEAASALVAIGARHESLAAEVRKVLASDGPPESAGHPWRQKNRRWLDMLWDASVGTIDARRGALASAGIERVAPNLAAASKASGEPQPTWANDPREIASIVGQMSAVGTGFLKHDGTYRATRTVMSMMAGWAGRADVEDFYPDEQWAKLAPRPWSREKSWALVDALGSDARKSPVKVEQKPGRNDPCSCGSGKKYKKCCGG